ncbi:hypothetical protein M6D93_16055 [Jatrophihabitans telluris]|uniref:LytR family transcriptional regulator n=1 Tax=Jatrophihabitans telluris TaxID=2038343 RepID=A0ABY4QXS7_9ACTN|nr:hypothetical protein [Jatrophihabitans telluris]UQX87801.1 hypothetical protein M6D93_16055 [Jatrophihabitans telluris]
MFEEVPGERSRLSRLRARRWVLGPFAVGGGVAVAALSGSVAVAATVITASTVGLPVGSRPHSSQVVVATASHSASSRHTLAGTGIPGRPNSPALDGRQSSSPVSSSIRPGMSPADSDPAGGVTGPAATVSGAVPSAAGSPSPVDPPGSSPSSALPSGSTTASPAPVGNAVIYVTGFDAQSSQVLFRYATARPGAGAGGTTRYAVIASSPRYRAGLDPRITVTSGTTICPPAGNRCTAAQLIAAAPNGFFAEAALDRGLLRSVIERDNAGYGGFSPAPSTTTSPSPSAPSSAPASSAAPNSGAGPQAAVATPSP